jgi:hypothetical protein
MNTSTGQPYNTQWTVQAPPETVIQQVTNAAAGCDGYSFQPSAANSVVLTRKYWPVWVIVVAVAGALLCLLGLLALLYKETETLTVTATEDPDGTRVDITGTGSTEAVGRINAVLSNLPGAHQSPAPAYAAAPPPPGAVGAVPAPPTPPPPPRAVGSVPAPPSPPGAGSSLPAPANPAAAWNPDPSGHHELRYWNGTAWTEHVSDHGTPGTDTVS